MNIDRNYLLNLEGVYRSKFERCRLYIEWNVMEGVVLNCIF